MMLCSMHVGGCGQWAPAVPFHFVRAPFAKKEKSRPEIGLYAPTFFGVGGLVRGRGRNEFIHLWT